MKNLTIVLFLFIVPVLLAQDIHTKKHRPFSKRFEELEKLKLLEVLNLEEEVAIKFFARRNQYKNATDNIFLEREAIYNKLEELLSEKKENSDYSTLIKQVNKQEIKLANLKSEFIDSLNDIFTNEQIAKLILFERNFKKGVRNLLIEKGRKKYRKDYKK